MQIGFEVTAAKPKGLRAAEEQPAQTPMRPREIAKNPTTDQKRVRRQMQRKMAVMNDVGECRLCGGDLVVKSKHGNTLDAECSTCGTEHTLQRNDEKTAAQKFAAFQNLSALEQDRIRTLAWWDQSDVECPECHSGRQIGTGWASGSGSHRMTLRCPRCEHHYEVPVEVSGGKVTKNVIKDDEGAIDHPREVARTAASETARLLNFVGAVWVPVVNTTPYLPQSGLSAIARRAQSVLDTEEIQ